MADYVKDAVLANEFHDLVLLRLVELTISAERSGRLLFSSLLDEPVFFRKYFQEWVHEALEERDRLMASQAVETFE